MNGCDSVVATTLTVYPTYDTTVSAVICEGDSVLLPGGAFADTQGTYYDTLSTSDGCDSVIATSLTVNLNPTVVIIGDTIACDNTLLDEGVGIPGDTYLWSTNDTTQTIVVNTTGMYWLIVTDLNGCQGSDSINVIVNPTYFTPLSDTICDGDSLLLGGTYQTTPGTYYDTLPTVNSCDSVIATTLTVNPLPVITVAPSLAFVCNFGDTVMLVSSGADSYTWSPATDLNTTTGDTVLAFPSTDTTYTVTGTSASGCVDSTTVSVQLSSAIPVAIFTANTTNFCEGNTITFNNTSTDATGFSWSFPSGTTADTTVQNPIVTYNSAGVFDVTLTAIGCSTDSTITMAGYITVNQIYTTSLSDTICDGDSLLLGGAYQTTPGTYYDTLSTVNGCDSVLATTLTVNPTYNVSSSDTICDGDSLFIGGAWQTTPGIYYDTSTVNGCDSILATTLTVNLTYFTPLSDTICNGDSSLIGGAWQTAQGTYYDTLPTVNGCDSVLATTLTVNLTYNVSSSDTICDGDSLYIGGAWQTAQGTYYDTSATVNGCDSVIATTLTVNPTYNVSSSDTICAGDSVFIGGAWQTTPGIYYDTSTVNGCDSIIITTLTVNQNDTITAAKSICFGDSIFLGGAYQTNAGIYYDTYPSGQGCDSVVITTLSVNPLPPPPTVTINGNQLASSPANAYQWYYYDTLIVGAISQFYTATQTGFYSVMIADINGCWSVSNPYFVTVTSINEIEFLNNLNIYPNPNTGELMIEMLVLNEVKELQIKLLNLKGQEIYKEKLYQYSGFLQKKIDLILYPKGVYILQVITNNVVVNKKVVFE
ncbi:MAG: T9SS type A sorting domain-containing protein [Solirubrobacterales bacterium]|nr:T9SS type A sorting domain-containing protein [Solirubrobacterales bacterium]